MRYFVYFLTLLAALVLSAIGIIILLVQTG